LAENSWRYAVGYNGLNILKKPAYAGFFVFAVF
jgi:hypothetical protein